MLFHKVHADRKEASLKLLHVHIIHMEILRIIVRICWKAKNTNTMYKQCKSFLCVAITQISWQDVIVKIYSRKQVAEPPASGWKTKRYFMWPKKETNFHKLWNFFERIFSVVGIDAMEQDISFSCFRYYRNKWEYFNLCVSLFSRIMRKGTFDNVCQKKKNTEIECNGFYFCREEKRVLKISKKSTRSFVWMIFYRENDISLREMYARQHN